MKSSMKLKWNCWEGLERIWQKFEKKINLMKFWKKKKKDGTWEKKLMNIMEDIWKNFENNCLKIFSRINKNNSKSQKIFGGMRKKLWNFENNLMKFWKLV